MSKYVNFNHIIGYLKNVRANRSKNDSPYMDNALLNIQQLLELDIHNPILFDCVEIGMCTGCKWKGRHQKCACCRLNRNLKDCYSEG